MCEKLKTNLMAILVGFLASRLIIIVPSVLHPEKWGMCDLYHTKSA